MNYGNIKFYDIANGEGIRTSLFVSGCTNHCPGCFNEEAQNFSYGQKYTKKTKPCSVGLILWCFSKIMNYSLFWFAVFTLPFLRPS